MPGTSQSGTTETIEDAELDQDLGRKRKREAVDKAAGYAATTRAPKTRKRPRLQASNRGKQLPADDYLGSEDDDDSERGEADDVVGADDDSDGEADDISNERSPAGTPVPSMAAELIGIDEDEEEGFGEDHIAQLSQLLWSMGPVPVSCIC